MALQLWHVLGASHRISIKSGLMEKSGGTPFLWWVTMVSCRLPLHMFKYVPSLEPWQTLAVAALVGCGRTPTLADGRRFVPPGAEADQADHSWEPHGIPNKFREPNRNIEVGDPQHERTMWVETIS